MLWGLTDFGHNGSGKQDKDILLLNDFLISVKMKCLLLYTVFCLNTLMTAL